MAFEIDFPFPDLDKGLEKIDKLIDKIRKLEDAAKKVRVGEGGGGVGSLVAPPSSSAGGEFPSGPYSRLASAAQRLQQAQLSGTDTQIADAQYHVNRLSRQVMRDRSGVSDPISEALRTTRALQYQGVSDNAGVGGGFSGLASTAGGLAQLIRGGGGVGSIGALARGGLAAAPLAIAAAYVGMHVKGMNELASMAPDRYLLGSVSGMNAGTTTALAGIGNLTGAGAAGTASQALAFGQALNQGSLGSAYFRSKGIVDMGPWTIDKGSNYLRALDELRKIPSQELATRVARDTKIEDQMWIRDLEDADWKNIKDGPRMTDEQRKRGAKINARKAKWAQFAQEQWTQIGSLTERMLEKTENAGWWNLLPGVSLYNFVESMVEEQIDLSHNLNRRGAQGRSGPINVRIPKNGDDWVRPGLRTTIPAGLRGQVLNESLEGQTYSAGAFTP